MEHQPTDDTTLRHEQIALRCAEITEVVNVMRRLSRGEHVHRYSFSSANFDWSRLAHVDPSHPVMAGHSLGGSAGVCSSDNEENGLFLLIAFVCSSRYRRRKKSTGALSSSSTLPFSVRFSFHIFVSRSWSNSPYCRPGTMDESPAAPFARRQLGRVRRRTRIHHLRRADRRHNHGRRCTSSLQHPCVSIPPSA